MDTGAIISKEAERLAARIRETQHEKAGKLTAAELVALCTPKELEELTNAHEAALILSAIAGRHISADYVKLLRLRGRLPVGKRLGERAYTYRVRDLLFVSFKQRRQPPADSAPSIQ